MKCLSLLSLALLISLLLLGTSPGLVDAKGKGRKYVLTIIFPGLLVHDLLVRSGWRVRKVKECVAPFVGVPAHELILLLGPQVLDDRRRLREYGKPQLLKLETIRAVKARVHMLGMPSDDDNHGLVSEDQ